MEPTKINFGPKPAPQKKTNYSTQEVIDFINSKTLQDELKKKLVSQVKKMNSGRLDHFVHNFNDYLKRLAESMK